MSSGKWQMAILLAFLISLMEIKALTATAAARHSNIHNASDTRNTNNQRISSAASDDPKFIDKNRHPLKNANNAGIKRANRGGYRPKFTRTSCGLSLCSYSRYYPYTEVNDAVNAAKIIMTSRSADQQRQLYKIDPEVLRYSTFYKRRDTMSRDYDKNGCKVQVNVTWPLEGISVDEGRAYYVVNIPSFEQRVPLVKCKAASARQTYRNEELLVLPLRRGEFDVGDFKIKTFRVPDACDCGTLENKL